MMLFPEDLGGAGR